MNKVLHQIKDFNESFAAMKEIGDYKYLPTFFDFVGAMLKYGASASDYFGFEFYNRKDSARGQFVCWKLKKRFMHAINDYSKAHIFDNKVEFLREFDGFAGRRWLDVKASTPEQFEEFCKSNPEFIAKAQNLSCGKGIRKVTVGDDVQALYEQLCEESALAEEIIVQHPEMSRLHPNAVNTIRVATVYIDGKMEILASALRCGRGSECVDNYRAGGFAAKVDPETGVVISDGSNFLNQRFYKHPETGVLFHGFQIPHWDKAIELLEKAVKVVPGVRYTGWDIAIRENDVVIVEGNFEGMFHILQQPGNMGIKDKVLDVMNRL